MIHVRYFASLREAVGTAAEELPPESATVADLLEQLRARGGPWAEALGGPTGSGRRILAAVNQEMARPDTPIADGDEVAFFPPVTGG